MIRPGPESLWLIGGVLALLGMATIVGWWLKRRLDTGLDPAIVTQFHLRLRTYWLTSTVLAMSLLLGEIVTVVLFGLLSFWALREFITLTPTRRADHRGLFWAFFVFTPLQYFLVAMNWHALYSVMIPAVAVLFLAARGAIAGDAKRFLERTAKMQAGMMLCVYCLSYAPALLTQELPARKEQPLANRELQPDTSPVPEPTSSDPGNPAASFGLPLTSAEAQPTPQTNGVQQSQPEEPLPPSEPASYPDQPKSRAAEKARLLFYFVLMAQLSDIMQYAWSRLLPGKVIAPEVNPAKTWSGYVGGILSAAVLGGALWWAIAPAAESIKDTFTYIAGSALLSAVVAAVGLAGGLTMSAIKRDRGVKDFGTLVVGHGGVLDRIDSLCFAAPVFFYLTRFLYWYDAGRPTPLPW